MEISAIFWGIGSNFMTKMKRRLIVYSGLLFVIIVIYCSPWLYGASLFLIQGGHSSFRGADISTPFPWHREPSNSDDAHLLWVRERTNIYHAYDDEIRQIPPYWQNSSQIDLPLWHKLYGFSNEGVFAQYLSPLGFTCGPLRQNAISKQVAIGCLYLKTGQTFGYQGSTVEMERASRIIGETAR